LTTEWVQRRGQRSEDVTFFAIAHRQRACRAFSPDDIADEVIEQVLDAATFAPSAENAQPWVFVVVRHPCTTAAIGTLTQKAWRGGAREYAADRLDANLLADVERGAEGGIADAPALVVGCADHELAHERVIGASIFPAIQNLLLAATALGLGSALTTLTTTFGAEMRKLLDLPEHIHPVAVVPLGYPAQPLSPPRRDSFAAKTHRERYGHAW
jgi:nitroreductase